MKKPKISLNKTSQRKTLKKSRKISRKHTLQKSRKTSRKHTLQKSRKTSQKTSHQQVIILPLSIKLNPLDTKNYQILNKLLKIYNSLKIKIVEKNILPISDFNELYPPQNELIPNLVDCKKRKYNINDPKIIEQKLDDLYEKLTSGSTDTKFINNIDKKYPHNLITSSNVNEKNKEYLFSGWNLLYSKYVSTIVNSCNHSQIKYMNKYVISFEITQTESQAQTTSSPQQFRIPVIIFSKTKSHKNDEIAIETAKRIGIIQSMSSKTQPPNVTLIRYNDKKKLPNQNESNIIFTADNVNSAVTDTYKNIIIYRDEELLKSVLHEAIHYYKLDFNNDNFPLKMRKLIVDNPMYQLDKNASKLLIAEAYTEWLANIINITLLLNPKLNPNSHTEFNNKYFDEIDHSIKKAINIYNLLKNRKLKDMTNTFSYYIIKLIFLIKTNELFNMLNITKPSDFNFKETYTNFEILFKLINEVNIIEIINLNSNTLKKKMYSNSMRMTKYG